MSDILGRYYTETLFSNLLIQQLDCKKPNTVLELGVGGGSILNAVRNEWHTANYYGIDVDKKIVSKYNEEKVEIKYGDVLDVSKSKLKISFGKYDIAVCNPPYSRLKNVNGEFDELMQSLNFLPGTFPITKDIVFLLKNLTYIKKSGKLGIIVPDTLITSQTYLSFRMQLLSNFEVEKIVELPSKIFKKTEAKTHILIIKNCKPKNTQIKLLLANKEGSISHNTTIFKRQLADRWDYIYNKCNVASNNKAIELGKISSIKRGSFTHIELIKAGCEYVHSTSYKNGDILKYKNLLPQKFKNKNYAKSGDIIITRVGSRSIGKVAFIQSGKILISDCVLIIRTSKKYQKLVFKYLSSEDFKKWISINSHGVCAQLISKIDLCNLKIQI